MSVSSQMTSPMTRRLDSSSGVSAGAQCLIIGAWSILPFAAVLIAPDQSAGTWFWTVASCLGVFCIVLYALYFGLTEALLVGLVFITNSAFIDPAYLPRVSFLGGNFFFSDYYIVAACCLALAAGSRSKRELLAGYRKQFVFLGIVVLVSAIVGLSRGADAHYVLRELHPLLYYPLAIVLAVRAFEKPGALSRVFVAVTGVVVVSCAATLWQLALIKRFQFMTYATQVFGLSEGEVLDAQSIRPPSQWLFLVFLLAAIASYPMWKKNRALVVGVVALDSVCIFLGYSRTILLAIAGALVVLGLMKKRRPMAFVWSATKATVAVGCILLMVGAAIKHVAPDYWDAFERRIIGSFETSLVDSDQPWVLGSRYYELEMAMEHIKEHPILGLGMGAVYREILPFEFTQTEVSENPDDAPHFIHNSYAYVWMKFGLVGVIAAVGIVWRFLKRAWKLAKSSGTEALAVRGIFVAFVGLAIANTVAPGFIASPAAPTLVGLMAALVEANVVRYVHRELATRQKASARNEQRTLNWNTAT